MSRMMMMGKGRSRWISATIYSATADADNPSNDGWSFRHELPLSGSSITEVRVSIKASTSQGLVASHVSIGRSAMLDNGACAATPVELLFGGAPGINVGSGVVAVSDWVAISGLGPSVNAMVTIDFTSGGVCYTTSPTGINKLWLHPPLGNPGYYATASGSGFSQSANDNRTVVLIETR